MYILRKSVKKQVNYQKALFSLPSLTKAFLKKLRSFVWDIQCIDNFYLNLYIKLEAEHMSNFEKLLQLKTYLINLH